MSMNRTMKPANVSLLLNLAYSAYHIVLGSITHSWWLLPWIAPSSRQGIPGYRQKEKTPSGVRIIIRQIQPLTIRSAAVLILRDAAAKKIHKRLFNCVKI